MRSYLSLIPLSAKVRRKQNRLTLICIILAVFLVTVIFSITDVWLSSEKETLIQKHGNYHIILNDVPESEAEQIGSRGDVAAFSWYGALNYDGMEDYYINGKSTILFGAQEPYIYDIRNFPAEGAYPQNDSEVMLSIRARQLLGTNIGDSITIDTPAGDFACIVSGLCDDEAELNDRSSGVICAYLNRTAFVGLCAANNVACKPNYYIQFTEKTKIKQTVSKIKEQYHLSDSNVDENTIILGIAGQSTKQQMTGLYPLAAVMFLLILTAGVLMISSCMNSNVAQRTQFFGMLRCIGASTKQIVRFVRLEALNWCKTAVPIGCGLGVAATWVLCKILRYFVGGEFASFVFRFSIIGIFCGIAVGIITVLLAAHSPAKRAAKVSPIAAVSGNAQETEKVSGFAKAGLVKVETALGINHAVASKKNLVLMTLSFAFTILLFFSFFAAFDFARALIPSSENFTTDIAITSKEFANTIDRSVKAEMEQIAGVDKIFSNSFALEIPAEINGSPRSIDLISYDNQLLEWAKGSVVSGNVSNVYGDSRYALTVFNRESRLNVGDKIKIGGEELEIAAVDSEGIWGGTRPIVYCSEETFTRLTGEKNYIVLNAMLAKDATEETVNKIRAAAGENEFVDRREENKTTNSSFWVFHLAAYGFLIIISLIMILNIMNSISMSVSARIKQYGAMRAIGMGASQLTRMITSEVATYAVCGLVLGSAAGLYMHRLITTKLIIEHFGGAWKLPAAPMAIVLILVSLSCIAAVYSPSKRIKIMSITDTLHAQ